MAAAHTALRETALAGLVDTYGELDLEPADDLFEQLTTSIINQLISTDAARTVRNQVFSAIDVSPEGVRAADRSTLREAGLSPQKIEYLTAAADWFLDESITVEFFRGMNDTAVIGELTQIRGIGVWTAKMTLMFGLGRLDVFPVEDLAVRREMTTQFGDESRKEMRQRAQQWAPYRSIATLYLWEAYTDDDAGDGTGENVTDDNAADEAL